MSEKGFARVRRVGLSLPGATEQIQWVDHLLLKVGGKMFVVLATQDVGPGGHVMSLKCSDDDFDRLTALAGMKPAPYLARAKWVAFESFDAVPLGELDGLVRNAYELVASKLPAKLRKSFGAPKPVPADDPELGDDDVPSMRDLMREEAAAKKPAAKAAPAKAGKPAAAAKPSKTAAAAKPSKTAALARPKKAGAKTR